MSQRDREPAERSVWRNIGLVLSSGCLATPVEEPSPPPAELLVFAAASLQEVVEALDAAYEPADIVGNFAGSNTLALQLEAAPVADVFFSANTQWMDRLAERGVLVEGSRSDLLSNQLQIVVRADSPVGPLSTAADLAEVPMAFLSLGDPEAVPAGMYARQFLESVSLPDASGTLWTAVASRVAPAPDVRAALGMVAQRADTVGIVYRTDAAILADAVRVIYTVPPELSPPIRYSVALVRKPPTADAEAFVRWLRGEVARDIFVRHGFVVLDE